MTHKTIKQTALTTESANKKFRNITGASFQGDVTFVSTLRAMLADRLGPEESITVSVITMNTMSDFENIANNLPEENSIRVYNCPFEYMSFVSALKHREVTEKLNCVLTDHEVGYSPVPVVNKYLSPFGFVYINAAKKSVAVFAFDMSVTLWHTLQTTIFRILPWYFGENPVVDDDLKAFLNSLLERDMVEYCDIIAKRAEELLAPDACEILGMK